MGIKVNRQTFDYQDLIKKVEHFKTKDISGYSKVKYEVGVGYEGTSYTIKVEMTPKMFDDFIRLHKKQNGFSLSTHTFRVEYFVEKLIKEPPRFQR